MANSLQFSQPPYLAYNFYKVQDRPLDENLIFNLHQLNWLLNSCLSHQSIIDGPGGGPLKPMRGCGCTRCTPPLSLRAWTVAVKLSVLLFVQIVDMIHTYIFIKPLSERHHTGC